MTGNNQGTAILLCTLNGSRHLREQLESIAQQDIGRCRLFVADDGSTDDTLAQISHWRMNAAFSSLDIRPGPGLGHVANFLSLLAADDIDGDFFAFADQDDIWDGDKLSRAITVLENVPPAVPALYCSRTRSIAETGEPIGVSPLFRRPPGFANALVQNIGGGNTMVMNRSARELLRQVGPVDVVSHDWWAYLLVSGAGGRIIYDAVPSLSYRQHSDNQIGANTGWKRRLKRYRAALGGRNRDWTERNIRALVHNEAVLTEEARVTLHDFARSRDGGLLQRLRGLRQSGLYAQTVSGNLGLYIASFLKKI